jgi:hypothetical protein
MALTVEKIVKQVNVLGQLFPGIGYANERLALQHPPKGAEDWYAVPKWNMVGKTYVGALEKALSLISNIRKGSLCPYYGNRWIDFADLKINKQTENAINILNIQQEPYDVIVFPCQLGINRIGQSSLDSKNNLSPWEFPLDPFSVACILLTHQDITLKSKEIVSILCPGSEYDRAGDGSFSGTPSFVFYDDVVEFIDIYEDILDESFGPATGFFHEFYY